jgi:Spy/CpxP family protein refolding chaperone
MKILKVVALATFLGVFSFINTALAEGPMDPYSMMPKMQKCSQYKALTADQKTAVDKIMQDLKNNNEPLMQQMMAKHKELTTLFSQVAIDEKAINSLATEISDLHSQMFAAHVKAGIDMAKAGFASGECWKDMHPMMQQKMEKHKKMMETQNSMPEAPAQEVNK